jgi:hypothetical protein
VATINSISVNPRGFFALTLTLTTFFPATVRCIFEALAPVGRCGARENRSFAPLGLVCFSLFPHGLRRGL